MWLSCLDVLIRFFANFTIDYVCIDVVDIQIPRMHANSNNIKTAPYKTRRNVATFKMTAAVQNIQGTETQNVLFFISTEMLYNKKKVLNESRQKNST